MSLAEDSHCPIIGPCAIESEPAFVIACNVDQLPQLNGSVIGLDRSNPWIFIQLVRNYQGAQRLGPDRETLKVTRGHCHSAATRESEMVLRYRALNSPLLSLVRQYQVTSRRKNMFDERARQDSNPQPLVPKSAL
jgi:hypothetical protein